MRLRTSVSWRSMVRTGFSEVIGSWKIIAIRLPRIPRIARRQAEQILSLEEDLAVDPRRRSAEAHQRPS